jgi:hypothetical protein
MADPNSLQFPWQAIAAKRADEFRLLAERNRRWCYALLGLGLHGGMLTRHSRRVYSASRHRVSCTVRPLFFDKNPNRLDTRSGLYSFSFQALAADDELAQKLADAVYAGLAIQGVPLCSEPPFVIKYPSRLVDGNRTCTPDLLLAWFAAATGSRDLDVMHVWQRIGMTTWLSHYTVAEVWRILPALLSPKLFEGSQFLCASLTDFSFPGDVETEYLAVPGRRPASFCEQVRVEGAVLNAFKAIEAVIGDPPKSEEKLRGKLVNVGVDPDKQVGYADAGLMPLINVVQRLQQYRDKQAAHGSTPMPRETTFRQLNEFQCVADTIIWTAIDRFPGVSRATIRTPHP